MQGGSLIFGFVVIAAVFYLICDSKQGRYAKFDERLGYLEKKN